MSRPILNRHVVTDVSWWHWTLTVPLLAAHLAGYPWVLAIAMVLCAAAGAYFWYRLRQVQPYPVQVRIAYLGLLAIGVMPWMQWMHWVQFFGTIAMVTVGYCPLIRMLSLVRPNRTEPLTALLVWRAFVKQPCTGGLLVWPAAASSPAINSCSLPALAGPSCGVAGSVIRRVTAAPKSATQAPWSGTKEIRCPNCATVDRTQD